MKEESSDTHDGFEQSINLLLRDSTGRGGLQLWIGVTRVELPDQTDVVVIGGGIMGTSTSYFLTRDSDLEVVLLEKDHVASGSTGDSSGILRHHYDDQEIYSRMAWWSHQFYRDFEDYTGQKLAYNRCPMVRFATEENREKVQEGYEILRSLDIPATRYENDVLTEQYPMIETETFEFAVSDDEAAYADGTDAAAGFTRAAQHRGATIVTGVAVEKVTTRNDEITGIETEMGRIECGAVVIAAGPWTPNIMDRLKIQIPLETTREQVFILEPNEEFANRYLDLLPSCGPSGSWYIRPDFGGCVLLATHHSPETVNPDFYSDSPDQQTLLELVEELEMLIPGLAESDVKGQYCGIYSTTPDHDFVIDQVGPEGCYVACGFSGHGFKHGPAVGKVLRDLVVVGDTGFIDVDYFSLERFVDQSK